MGKAFKILKWDTFFFGYNVALLIIDQIKTKNIIDLVNNMKKSNIKLAYCFIDAEDRKSNTLVKLMNGYLADEKITYIKNIDQKYDLSISPFIRHYSLSYVSKKLLKLALQSGIYSRFKTDIKFKNNEFEKLYTEWINNSIKKEGAKEVLVYYKDEEELGFIAIEIKRGTGYIVLIAVEEEVRGRSIGKELIKVAFNKFKENNVTVVKVITQKANNLACNFYSSLGFKVNCIENVYHIWIENEDSI